MLEYAGNLTVEPAGVTPADTARLREASFSDEAILAIASTTDRYAMINRIMKSLGCNPPRAMDREAERLGVPNMQAEQQSTG